MLQWCKRLHGHYLTGIGAEEKVLTMEQNKSLDFAPPFSKQKFLLPHKRTVFLTNPSKLRIYILYTYCMQNSSCDHRVLDSVNQPYRCCIVKFYHFKSIYYKYHHFITNENNYLTWNHYRPEPNIFNQYPESR